MADAPVAFELTAPSFAPSRWDNHIERRLSVMRGQWRDAIAFDRMLGLGDPVLYEVYERRRPERAGELLHGVSIVHPGKVGDEFFMTKGHFHAVLETAEIYHCLAGEGRMVMETPEGEWAVEELYPARVLYVPPRWAHRSVNTSAREDLVTLFVYPADAGHDYGTIERRGFRKLVIERAGSVVVVDNPRWAGGGR
jgi:glucose-6-phosphate isomerase, archaeal